MASARTAIVLAVIALGLLGYVLLVDRGKLTSGELEARKGNALPELVRERVTKLEIQRKGTTTVLVRTLGGTDEEALWRVQAPYSAKADQEAVDALLGELEWVDARRTMDEISAADRKRFGFESPRYRVFFTAGNQRISVLVGNPSPRGDGVYVQVGGRASAFVVGKDLLEALAHEPEHFHDKTLHEGVLLTTTGELAFVDGQGERVVQRRKDGLWALRGAGTASVELASEQAVTEVVNALDNLRAARFVAAGVHDLARYGLAQPRLQLRVRKRLLDTGKGAGKQPEPPKRPDAELRIQIGAACQGHPGESYLAVGGSSTVYCALDADVDKLARDLAALREMRLLPLEGDEVESVHVQRGGSRMIIRKTESGFRYEVIHGADPPLTGDARGGSVEDWLKALREARAAGLEAGALPRGQEALTLRIERGKDKAPFELLAQPGALGSDLLVRRADESGHARFPAAALELLEPGAARFRKLELLSDSESAVQNLELRRGGTVERLERAPGTSVFRVTTPASVLADPVLAPELARQLASLQAVRFVADSPLPAHGFEAADTSIVFELARGADRSKVERVALRAGAETEGGRYARLDGQRGVFVIGAQLVQALAEPLASRSALAVPLEHIAAIEIEQGARRLRVERSGEAARSTGPVAVTKEVARDLVSRVATLRALRATGYGPPDPSHGLARPFALVHVDTLAAPELPAGRRTLRIGSALEGDARHARRDDLPAGFVLGKETVEALLAPLR